MTILTIILAIFTLISLLATTSVVFYNVRQKTIRQTLEASNKAYAEHNGILIADNASLKLLVIEKDEQIRSLKRIKTPSLKPLIELVKQNHKNVMKQLEKKA